MVGSVSTIVSVDVQVGTKTRGWADRRPPRPACATLILEATWAGAITAS
jgi:hypothetical protein